MRTLQLALYFLSPDEGGAIPVGATAAALATAIPAFRTVGLAVAKGAYSSYVPVKSGVDWKVRS